MCVCVCVCVCVCCIYIYIYMYIKKNIYIYTAHTHTHTHTYIYIYIYMCVCVCVCVCKGPLDLWVVCSPMFQEAGVQSQVESYQRLKKCHLMPPCLRLSIIYYCIKGKGRNPGKGEAPSLNPRCCSYWKWSLRVALDYGWQLYHHYHHRAAPSARISLNLSRHPSLS